jgi:ribA/ribD-fused uncharacterized protein
VQDDQHLAQLRARFNGGEPLNYLFFWGHQPPEHGVSASCFSQWYVAPFVLGGDRYATAEHYMMAEKASLFGDLATRDQILRAPNPKAAKALGRKVRGFDESAWVEARFPIVCRANEAKFTQNPQLGAYLVETGTRVLVEASPFDRIWGIGLAKTDARVNDPNLWLGLNLLGFVLMQVRLALSGS